MQTSQALGFLRPSPCRALPVTHKQLYLRFFHTTRWLGNTVKAQKHKEAQSTRDSPSVKSFENAELRKTVDERVKELEAANALLYPRIKKENSAISCAEFNKQYSGLRSGETRQDDKVVVRGRMMAHRVAGKGLMFLDIWQDGQRVQGVCNNSVLGTSAGSEAHTFREFYHLVRRGDIVSICGLPSRTNRGQLSVTALELPKILTPALANIPLVLEDPEARIRNRHLDLLVNQLAADTIRARAKIIQGIRDFLLKDKFVEVQTPIIAGTAGGALARPFTTAAKGVSERELALRIAPEIWLKRMVIGGLDRVFEIGPAFRNEGLDATHNPEFTTCEFYKSFADLEELMTMTEQMLSGLVDKVANLRKYRLNALPDLDVSLFATPFKRVLFVPAIEAALGQNLPDLATGSAAEQVISIFVKHSIPLPDSLKLPRLLDKLSSHYIESRCNEPTFILHPPACMAPLAKSFLDPITKQIVSARAELFIQQREMANMYEEENSPFEQRAKFVQQAQYKDDENRGDMDEGYLESLAWGLPPTGGWGCGIDRLVMLFTGATRITDVLSFGNLRNVVNLSSREEVPRAEDVAKSAGKHI